MEYRQVLEGYLSLSSLEKARIISYIYRVVVSRDILPKEFLVIAIENIDPIPTKEKPTIDTLPGRFKLWKNGVGEGIRNDAMCSLIGFFRFNGLSLTETEEQMRIFNERCSPPEDVGVLKRKIEHFYALVD